VATARFDDGSNKVPAGVAGDAERVIVVGAGIAGLTVANALTHAGVECVVLEGRDRVGGRLHTIEVAGHRVDMGGSWIHMPVGNPLTAFADAAGIARHPGDPLAELVAYDCIDGRLLSPQEWADSVNLQYEAFPAAQDSLLERLGSDASMADAINAFLDDQPLPASELRRARQALQAVVEAESADFCDRQSLRWMWNEDEYEGSYFGDLPSGGYFAVVDAMAGGLDIRTGVEVSEVAHGSDGVAVTDTTGRVERGSHVVVTVPLGVIKEGRPRFSPALPPDRLDAIDRLGFGTFEKVALAFSDPFWRTAGAPHIVLFPRQSDEPAIWTLGLDAFGGGPVLVVLVFRSSTHRVLDQDEDPPVQWLLDMLSEAFGGACPQPVATARSTWQLDPWARGAYTHLTPGSTPADADLLGQPVGGRVLFAGEHTQSARLAYADGAMSSGVREAKRLLHSPNVVLSADATRGHSASMGPRR
jgi:polyamine oxidase